MYHEELLADLFENTTDIIQSVSSDGKLIVVNPAWYNVLGYPKENLSSMYFLDIVHPEDRHHCGLLFNEVMAGGSLTGIDVRFITKDGRILFMNGNVFAEKKNGQIRSTRGIFRDVSESKIVGARLKQSELKYRELVELASDIIYKTDIYGNITFINDSGTRLTGYDREEMVGKHFSEFVRPDALEDVSKFYREQIASQTKRTFLEFPFVRKDREIRWFAQSVRLLLDEVDGNQISGSISVCRDVTEIREIRERMREQNSLLNRQNQQLREAYQNLVRAKIGKKALGITFIITIILFIASEGILEPIVDSWHNGDAIGFASKGIIALLFKPIDMLVERALNHRAFKQHKFTKS